MVSPIFYKIPLFNDRSLCVEEGGECDFCNAVHFHDEYQLTYITNGEGDLIVGNTLHRFSSGDIFLFGKNLPHVFKTDKKPRLGCGKTEAGYTSIFFKKEVLDFFFENADNQGVIKSLEYASYGLKFEELPSNGLKLKIQQIDLLEGSEFGKFLELLFILEWIFDHAKGKQLSAECFRDMVFDEKGGQRIKEVFTFMKSNYNRKISVSDVAGKFNMTPSAFCRFFKSRTRKSFSRFLAEIRILAACELLRRGTHNVTESCFEVGFTNFSNFHRHFKRIMDMTPSQYKNGIPTFVA